MTKENGGAAFPVAAGPGQQFTQGMSLRDWFAGTAPITFGDAIEALKSQTDEKFTGADILQMLAELRGGYADAMLAEREKGGGE